MSPEAERKNSSDEQEESLSQSVRQLGDCAYYGEHTRTYETMNILDYTFEYQRFVEVNLI